MTYDASRTHADEVERAAWTRGVRVLNKLPSIRAVIVRGRENTCDVLLGLRGITHCEQDSIVHAL